MTYDAGRGKFTDNAKKRMGVGNTDEPMTVPADPSRTGYTFLGWFTTPTGDVEAPVLTKIPTANVTYFAQWELNDITVTMKLTGGEINESNADVTYKGKFDTRIAYTEPTRIGFVFIGWKLPGTADSTAQMQLEYPAQDTTYEAVWADAANVTVVYYPLEGEIDGIQSSFVGKSGTTFTVPGVKDFVGYEFHGWYDNPDFSGVPRQPGQTQTFTTRPKTAYFAQCTKGTNHVAS